MGWRLTARACLPAPQCYVPNAYQGERAALSERDVHDVLMAGYNKVRARPPVPPQLPASCPSFLGRLHNGQPVGPVLPVCLVPFPACLVD